MSILDSTGHALSGATPKAAAIFDTAVQEFSLFRGDPVASVERAVGEAPDFVMGHALHAWLHALSTEPAGIAVARRSLATARLTAANRRELGHLTALEHLVAGRWLAAGETMEDVSIEFPHDVLALQVGHQLDFFTGNARLLRDRIARALPHWSEDMPHHHALLGMYAFGLEECGQYAAAEAAGRRAVEREPADAWAQHAVAHVMEMQGRANDGIRWMTADIDAWAKDNFFARHNWWHLALYHIEHGDTDQALALFDGPIYGTRSRVVMDMVDASALLWRLHLVGVDVGERWNHVADAWEPLADAGNYAFNDVHAAMAFVGAERRGALERLLVSMEDAMRGAGDNAWFTAEVGQPLVRGIAAFGDGRYADALRLIRPIRHRASRFGGSHAQRDVIDQTLLEAALRSGRGELARALAAERMGLKPHSPLARLFAGRAAAIAAVA